MFTNILYKADLEMDLDLQIKQTWTYRKGGPFAKTHYNGQKCIFDKLEGAEFKYDNSFIKFQSKNTQIRHFLSQFFLTWNFAFQQI